MSKPSITELDRLYLQGDRLLHQEEYGAAIAIFEPLLEVLEPTQRMHFDVQRGLVKAYQQNQQLDRAIALCQLITQSNIASTALWGENFLAVLNPDYTPAIETPPETLPAKVEYNPRVPPKTLAQFKQYCQQSLIGELTAFERKRRYTLKTIWGSALFCLIATWVFCLATTFIVSDKTQVRLNFHLICLLFTIPPWIVFCRGAIHNYRLGFKRNIIASIVDFLSDEDRQLNYAAHLFLENKRQTIMALCRSQILPNRLREPDYLEQEDCVYGQIGNTELFVAEIFVANRRGNHLDESGREVYLRHHRLFHGLFFEAQFVKSFACRTFVIPNDVRGRVAALNSWRGEAIALEDPEFARLFCVYGDSQVESRYLLSTNLMSRLVEFRHRAGRKVTLSFVDGFVYLAIPYQQRLFEPKLLTSMMSFAPLKEYFQDLQLAIAIVEDLNLNRRIWQ
ncbi:MAG: DUF3137 domain-containing protein [Cyanobacteria bacterium J06623_7]